MSVFQVFTDTNFLYLIFNVFNKRVRGYTSVNISVVLKQYISLEL